MNMMYFQKMLILIADRLERRVCDDVLEVAWSTMWNVTDETPDNCKRFLDNNGLYFFLSCLEVSNHLHFVETCNSRVISVWITLGVSCYSASQAKKSSFAT